MAGALAQHAEATLDRIGAERQGMVREIFRNLVTAQGTRAVAEREELLSVFPERKAAEEVLRELIDARLLTSYEVEGAGGRAEPPPGRDRARVAAEGVAAARAVAGAGRGGGAPAGPAEAGGAPVGGEGAHDGPAVDGDGVPGVRAVAGAVRRGAHRARGGLRAGDGRAGAAAEAAAAARGRVGVVGPRCVAIVDRRARAAGERARATGRRPRPAAPRPSKLLALGRAELDRTRRRPSPTPARAWRWPTRPRRGASRSRPSGGRRGARPAGRARRQLGSRVSRDDRRLAAFTLLGERPLVDGRWAACPTFERPSPPARSTCRLHARRRMLLTWPPGDAASGCVGSGRAGAPLAARESTEGRAAAPWWRFGPGWSVIPGRSGAPRDREGTAGRAGSRSGRRRRGPPRLAGIVASRRRGSRSRMPHGAVASAAWTRLMSRLAVGPSRHRGGRHVGGRAQDVLARVACSSRPADRLVRASGA